VLARSMVERAQNKVGSSMAQVGLEK